MGGSVAYLPRYRWIERCNRFQLRPRGADYASGLFSLYGTCRFLARCVSRLPTRVISCGMSQPIQTTRVEYEAVGTTTGPFVVPFRFFLAGDLRVEVNGVEVPFTAAGMKTPTGGTITLVTAAADGDTVVIWRDTAPERETDFPETGPFRIGKLNDDLDRLTAVDQDIQTRLDRMVQGPADEEGLDPLPAADARAGRMLAFDETTGQPEVTPFTTDMVAAVIDAATLNLVISDAEQFEGDGVEDSFPLPVAWGTLVSRNSVLVDISGTGIQTPDYSIVDGATLGDPGRSYIVFNTPPPKYAPIEVRIPPAASGVGDVTGPPSSTPNAIALFDGATGLALKNGVTYNNIPITATDSDTARTLANRFADWINVKDEGAVGDGATDDLAAIQAAIARAIANGGGTVWLPAGNYDISDTLTIADAGLVNLVGDGSNATTITLTATDRPIISMTECGTGRPNFHWSGLTLAYATQATTAHTSSVAVAFKTGSGTPAFGYYNFEFHDLVITGAYIGIGNRFGATPPNIWGFDWNNIRFHNFAFRAWDITNTGTGGGSPNSSIRNAYLIGRSGLTYTDSIAYWDCGDAYQIANLEVNSVTTNMSTGLVYLGGTRAGKVHTSRFEDISIAGGTIPALIMIETHYVSVDGIVAAVCSVASGVTAAVLRTGTGALATLRNVQTLNITGAGLLVGALETSAGQVLVYEMASPDSGRWIRNGGYFAPRVELQSDGVVAASVSVKTPTVQAASSAGLALKNSSGTDVLTLGAGPGTGATFAGGANVNGTLSGLGAVNLSPANATVTISPTGTGTVTINPATAGTVDNVSIGATTRGSGAFTTLTANAAVTLSPANASVTMSPTGTGTVTMAPATAGALNNVSIGQTTPLAGGFTTLSTTGNATIGGTLTVTGAVVSSSTSYVNAGAQLGVANTAGNVRDFVIWTGTTGASGGQRWIDRGTNTAESGANVGTDWQKIRRADDGSNLGVVMHATRSTGVVSIGGAPGSECLTIGNGTSGTLAHAGGARTIVDANSNWRLRAYTVATLPTATAGTTAAVSDANATTYQSIVAGGGANFVPVYADGTNWRIG